MQNTTKQSKLIKLTTKHNVSLYKHNKTESESESTITSYKSRANNLIVVVNFWLMFTSNSGFQLFLGV